MVTSPLPSSLEGECRKAAKILNSFIDPGQGLDKIIPPSIISKAKGLAIFTVLKAGFIFSGRAGAGLVIARLADGSWSAPCAIGTLGAGFGGQVGAELTDFVIVLNTKEAVKTFSHGGNITLGGNLSVAIGPIGRNVEAAGVAAFKHVAAVYSYSKTRGFFAGVSLEGSVIVTRHLDNVKMYRQQVTAKQLLSGNIPPPPQAQGLYQALDSRFGGSSTLYNNEPVYGYSHEDRDSRETRFIRQEPYHEKRSQTAPNLAATASRDNSTARALYNFVGQEKGDLSFRKGDLIYILKRTSSQNDWWTGRIGDREGMFPANFVQVQ